jgi:bifunctional oligoribonuclease and PAP phosphatase NrnA
MFSRPLHPVMTNLESLKEFLSKPRSIVIVTHPHPDGDAMGSSFGLYNYLIQKKHRAWVVLPTSYAEFLNWFPGLKSVLVYPNHKAFIEKSIEGADLIFCLDFNALNRINDIGEMIKKSKAKKAVIDHHQQPEDFADFLFSEVKASSTSEMVFDFMEMMGDEKLLNPDIAACLYAGIMTDTGSFQFSSTSPKVHRIAAMLLEQGIDFVNIHNRINNSFSENRLRLFGFSITERMKIFPEYKCAVIWLTKEDLQKFQIKIGDTEGLVNYPLKIKGINMAVLIVDRTEQIKLSFRSIGKFDVNQLSRKYFNGGGHINAAGGQSKETLEQVLQKFESILPEYKEQLNY